MKVETYAAIDIGSNAIRMLVANVLTPKEGPTQFHKNALVRVPIRLGQDAFGTGEISKKNYKRLRRAMKAFKHIMKIHKVHHFSACATAALREATNGKQVQESIQKETGIFIDIIDGKKEASLISHTRIFDQITTQKTVLYVDVGGGSTEYSILRNGTCIASKSFKIGTVRLLNKTVAKTIWSEIQKWIESQKLEYSKITVLGSGGNINKLFKIAGVKEGKPLSYVALSALYTKIACYTYEERMLHFQLNPDRADVILPAATIYLKTLLWAGASKIYVPKIGLSDGMIKEMYYNMHER